MRRLIGLCAVLWLACACSSGTSHPVTTVEASGARLDPHYNPAVTQANIATTICHVGYSASIRPPLSYTASIKRSLIDALPPAASHEMADYELDHLVPLEDGGHPKAPENLVLQLWPEARVKDAVEDRVHRAVCSHRITLAVGRRCFVIDWKECP